MLKKKKIKNKENTAAADALMEIFNMSRQVTDGFGNFWNVKCPECGENSMVVVRPGKIQCCQCE